MIFFDITCLVTWHCEPTTDQSCNVTLPNSHLTAHMQTNNFIHWRNDWQCDYTTALSMHCTVPFISFILGGCKLFAQLCSHRAPYCWTCAEKCICMARKWVLHRYIIACRDRKECFYCLKLDMLQLCYQVCAYYFTVKRLSLASCCIVNCHQCTDLFQPLRLWLGTRHLT